MNNPPVATQPILRLTDSEHRALRMLIASITPGNARMKTLLQPLSAELERAKVLPDTLIPDTVVRMGSVFEVEDLGSGEVDTYTLVYPNKANAEAGLISILVPLGMGVIGFAEGDTFHWKTPGGVRNLRLRKVAPPVPET